MFIQSCETDITVDLPNPEQRIVVEGILEPGKLVSVFLSYNAAFFAPLDTNELLKYTVKNAIVIVNDGVKIDTMKEALPGIGYIYVSNGMIGTIGRTYNLTVIADGKTVTARTTIPPPIALDSVWFRLQEFTDTLGFAWGHLTDPDTLGNNYRWLARRIGKDKDFVAPIGSVFEDKFINGKSFDFGYNRGKSINSEAEDDKNEEEGFFKVGDTIIVKFCTMDREHFEFWRTAETQISNNGNFFGSPSTIKTNVKGGLGIWGAYSPTFDTIIATK